MLQRIERNQSSIADAMIRNFNKDDSLKESLKLLERSIELIKHNRDHSEELALLRLVKLAIREKILLLAYD
jgi:hypothetical protein